MLRFESVLNGQFKLKHFPLHPLTTVEAWQKGTDLEGSDFDIVMKINNRYPPFSEVLQFFKRILTEYCDDLEIVRESVQVTPYSVQFTFENQTEVDLLPAINNLTTEQILQKMARDPKRSRYYSSSLVETQVAFMKEQSAFANALARLAKHWYISMECPYYVSGASGIFEILGVAAAFEQNGSRERESMSLGFERIVEMVANLDEIGIKFEKSGQKYQLVGSNLETPYLLEPANPNNNFMDGIDEVTGTFFMRNGEEMKGRLWNLMEKRQYCKLGDVTQGGSGFNINFRKLFKTFDCRESDSESEGEEESSQNARGLYNYWDGEDD